MDACWVSSPDSIADNTHNMYYRHVVRGIPFFMYNPNQNNCCIIAYYININ